MGESGRLEKVLPVYSSTNISLKREGGGGRGRGTDLFAAILIFKAKVILFFIFYSVYEVAIKEPCPQHKQENLSVVLETPHAARSSHGLSSPSQRL